jgi:hypothetical protein
MGKVSIAQLQEWFPNPEAELQKFMGSGQAIMSIMFDGGRRAVELNQRDVAQLLEEFRSLRETEE